MFRLFRRPAASPIETSPPQMRQGSAGGGSWLRGKRLIPVVVLATSMVAGGVAATADALPVIPNLTSFPDPSGSFSTFSTAGAIDTSNPFFQSLGTNGRSCATCHVPADGWSIAPAHIQLRFSRTHGTDPLFRPNDGSTSPLADLSTVEARRDAYQMLLAKGVIRVGLTVPAGADFVVTAVDDPYSYAGSAADPLGPALTLSLFRRPLPAANLPFLSAVMWDGRETVTPLLLTNSAAQNAQALAADLAHQANDATLGHAQGAIGLTSDQQQDIVAFESGLFTAQTSDAGAGDLTAKGAKGGPRALAHQAFAIGANNLGPGFDPVAMTLFSAWGSLPQRSARAAVARGEIIFNQRPIAISGVAGLPDMAGTCTTCHNTPNVGNHSVSAPLNIGIADASRRTPDLPLYTLTCADGTTVQTTDPGRALISGKCADIGKFKGPILRDLAARAPYFHNGSAATLQDVVTFYNTRFNLQLSAQQQADLVAFLRSL